jgi:outer membrane protein TolC
VRVLRADAQLRARQADSALAAELVDVAVRQRAAGMGVALDVTRARAQLEGARAGLITARTERDIARLALRRALGLPLDAPLLLSDSLAATSACDTTSADATADDVDTAAVASRPRGDLLAAQAAIGAARRQLAAVRAERLPALTAFADRGATGPATGRLPNTYTWGLQLSVPAFDGLRREARVAEGRATLRELEVRQRDLTEQAALDVRAARLALASSREQLTAGAARLALAEEEIAQARERFAAGVAGNADVITASLSLNAARTAAVDAMTAYQTARVSLARSQGALTELP